MAGSRLYKPELSSSRKKNYGPNLKSNLTYWGTTCNVTFHECSSTEMFLIYNMGGCKILRVLYFSGTLKGYYAIKMTVRADSHYMSRFCSIVECHRSVKFSHM